MFFYLVSLTIAELLKFFVFPGGGGVSASSAVFPRVSELSEFWFDSIFSFRFLYGGTISAMVLVVLATLGMYKREFRRVPVVYFNVFLVVTSLLFMIGDDTIKSRLLYNVPVGLFAAVGFSSLLRLNVEINFKKYLIYFIILNLLVYLFRSLANFI